MRLTRAKAAAANIHVDGSAESDEEFASKTLSVHGTPIKSERGPLGEVSPNSIKGHGNTSAAGTPEPIQEEWKKQVTPKTVGVSQDMDTSVLESMQEGSAVAEQTDELANQDTTSTVNSTVGTPKAPAPDFNPLSVPKNTQAGSMLAKQSFGMRSTSNKENMQPFSPAAQAIAPPQANVTFYGSISENERTSFTSSEEAAISQIQSQPAEDPIEAMDALEEALEKVDSSLPKIEDIVSPQKSQTLEHKRQSTMGPPSMKKTSNNVSAAGTSRASFVRRSTGVRPQAASSGAVKRNSSVKGSLARSSTVRRSSPLSNGTNQGDRASEKVPVDIPHSKPRPMSMSFPMPPPPARSSKPQTRPTFQLPGEAIAAKLKAAKEERQRKEEEEQVKRPQFKARPAPKMKENVAPVRQTALSRARESLMLGKDGVDVKTGTTIGLKRTSSLRESMMKPRNTPTMAARRLSTAPKTNFSASVMASSKARPSDMGISKRASIATANSSKPRISSIGASGASRTGSGSTTTTTSRGKEVFQRAAVEKDLLEQKKREKEEAARKARVDAAERGRLASREWAEKQARRKAAAAKNGAAGSGKEDTIAAVAAV